MSEQSPQEQEGNPASEPTPKAAKGCSGCLSLIVIFPIVFWIADFAGCGWTRDGTPKATVNGRSTADPGTRHVGPLGAVVGYDNYGRPTLLPPGTTVRATGSTYSDPMAGPKTIYIVAEGAFRGTQVPLSEYELEPQ
jgi:hypothetical protein